MAEWEGDAGYFWGNEMNNEADWDFDALNEIDWNVWDELAPPPADLVSANLPPPPPANAPSHHHHERNISSSSATLEASSPATPWANSPPARVPASNLPTIPPQNHIPTGSAASSAPLRHYQPPPPPSHRHATQAARSGHTNHTAAFGYQVNHPQQREPSPDTSSSEDLSTDDDEEEEEGEDASFLLLPEIFETSSSSSSEEEGEEDMPSAITRRRQNNGGAVVDLTQESSPRPEGSDSRQPRPHKRSAPSDSPTKARSKKRTRPSSSAAESSHNSQPIEEFDLTNETTTAEEEVRRAQQQAAIAAQQAADNGDGPVPIGKRQCIICLEPFTDVTITHCGHIYCHECLTQALNAGEKNGERGVGTCPICRKPVKRNKQNQMIVVSFMKKETYGKGKGRSLVY